MILFLAVFIVLAWVGNPGIAEAEAQVEALCPNGSSPRADITKCMNYDDLDNCTTGREDSCWQDNGYTAFPTTTQNSVEGYTIVGGGGAVGSGYVRTRPGYGGTGAGHGGPEPVPGFTPVPPGKQSMNFRYYIRYSRGAATFDSGHGPQMNGTISGAADCAVKYQLTTYSGDVYVPCNPTQHHFVPNQSQPTILLNNRWYMIEIHATIDTSCTNSSVWDGCNGVLRVWLDEVLTHEYTTVNFGGVVNNMGWGVRWDAPEMYFHYMVPPWGMEIAWDNFVVSNNGTYIGRAANDCSTTSSCGVGDTSSPYRLYYGAESYLGHRTRGDCFLQGYISSSNAQQYRNGAGLDNTIQHGLYVESPNSSCTFTVASVLASTGVTHANSIVTVSDGTSGGVGTTCTGGSSNTRKCKYDGAGGLTFTNDTDASMKVNLTSSGTGGGHMSSIVAGEGTPKTFSPLVMHGWQYLLCSNNYTVTNLAIQGFTRDDDNPASGYIAVGLSNGKWAIVQKNTSGVSQTPLESSVTMTCDTWHEYELIIWDDNKVSLMIDRARLFTRAATSSTISWAFDQSEVFAQIVTGIIDFQGTAPFVVYFDDTYAGSVSAWECTTWGAASCPFAGGFMNESLNIQWSH